MAKDCSFDIVSDVDMQEVDNAVNQARKEIATRYDFKGSKSSIELEKDTIILIGDDDFKLNAVADIVRGKLVRRGVSLKNVDEGTTENAAGGLKRRNFTIRKGLSKEHAKEIVKIIKNRKRKASTQIMDNQVRVSGKDIDELQNIIMVLKETDFPVDLQFVNYRS